MEETETVARWQFVRITANLFIFVWLFGATLCAWADPSDDYILSRMRQQHIPGLSLVVVRSNHIVKAKGYGLANVELNVPAAPNTVYQLASLTKQFTATAIMLLVQDGKLGLDDKISRYVAKTPESWQNITIREFLTQTSGIKDELNELHGTTQNGTNPEEIVSAMAAFPLDFAPGTQWSYSNTNYLLLGMIIRNVSGKPFHDFLAAHVFQPLHMTATRLDSRDDIIPNRAAKYVWENGRLSNSRDLDLTLWDNGEAGLISSALDLARWDIALDGNRILNASSRKQMWTPVRLTDGTTFPYGFGWFVSEVNGHPVLCHSGSGLGVATYMVRYVDERLTVIVLVNEGAADPDTIARHVAGLFVPTLIPARASRVLGKDPEAAALVKTVLLKAQKGTLDPGPFTAEMWKGMDSGAAQYLRQTLGLRGVFKSIVLLARTEHDGIRSYRYRVFFGDTSLIVECSLTKEDKISDMGLTVE